MERHEVEWSFHCVQYWIIMEWSVTEWNVMNGIGKNHESINDII